MTTRTVETAGRWRRLATLRRPRPAAHPDSLSVGGERAWPWLLIPLLATAVLYGPIFPRLVHEWSEFANQSHGSAIPLVSAYLLWARRKQIAAAGLAPSFAGLPLLLLGLVGLVIGIRGQESFLARLSLPVTLLGLTLFVGGRELFRHAWMSIAYLTFMIPLPWTTLRALTYQSRIIDAWASAEGARLLGVPVYREGFYLIIPNGRLEVADVCSSIPAIAALLALGAAYAIVRPGPRTAKVLLIAATLPLAVMSNIIRITTTVAGVYYIGPWTLQSVYHQFNGTVNFVLTLALLLLFDGLLVRLMRARA
jgi:exosortase